MPDQFSEDSFFEELAAGAARSEDLRASDRLKNQILSALTGDLAEDERFFATLAASEATATPVPSRLKSKIYSALVLAQAETGALLSLPECKAGGRQLCIFEELVQIAPVGQAIQSVNYCRVCHARVLGERVEGAPIYWAGCPYVSFQNR
jgi:hypothetical protein